jgi:cellulose biosynthesis protein BcsQ
MTIEGNNGGPHAGQNANIASSSNTGSNTGVGAASPSSIVAFRPSANNNVAANLEAERVPGRIITFYSYKGGVGRSFALANVAAILSRWGARVLCVDWDLEAPGLHHFFPEPNMPGTERGLLQLLESASPHGSSECGAASASVCGLPIDWRSCVHTATIGQTDKTIDLIPAGRSSEDYVRRVHDLDWQALYERHSLGDFLERLRQEWTRDYDFVLLDSRTGLTDIGGICTIHLPDVVVSVFTANHQSMEGTAFMAGRINQQRRDFFYSSGKALIMPLLSRWEERDAPEDAKQWLPKVLDTLRPSYDQWRDKNAAVERLVELLKIPYKAKWNFGERLAVLEESATDPGSVSYHWHIIAATLARDFRATDVLASEPERYVRIAAQEAPRKRIAAVPNERDAAARLRSNQRARDPAGESEAEILADVFAFVTAALTSDSGSSPVNLARTSARSSDRDASHQDTRSAELDLMTIVKPLLKTSFSDSEVNELVNQLKAFRGQVGRSVFQAITSSAAKEMFDKLSNLFGPNSQRDN